MHVISLNKTTIRRAPTMTNAQRERGWRKENIRDETILELKRQKAHQSNMSRIARLDDIRFVRTQMLVQREIEMDETIVKGKRDCLQHEEEMAQTKRLAEELECRKLDSIRDEKMRQQIRETSLELRELEAKLRSAYMNKERVAQIAEKEAVKLDRMKHDAEILKTMMEENKRAEEADREREKERYKQVAQYQQDLNQQLVEQELKKQEAYKEFLREKLMIDEIVRKIYEEDQRANEKTLAKQKATQKYVEEFKKAREHWRKLEKERMDEENRRLMEYGKEQQQEEVERILKKKEKDNSMAKVQQALGEEIHRQDNEKEEMERVRLELHLEEQEVREQQKERELMERRIWQRLELQSEHAQYMHFQQLRKEAEKQEEERFRQQMMAKFATDDRIEQMNAQKRRMKQLEHKRAVEQLLEDRRQQFIADKERQLKEGKENERIEAFRRHIIEEERQKLLKEHALRLLGYLPKGVIRDAKDLERLGPEFKNAYQQRQIDVFNDEGWNQR